MKTNLEIIDIIKNENDLQTVQIIRSSDDLNKCSIVIGDKMFSMMYETKYDEDLINDIKLIINGDVLFISYFDIEIADAWKLSYLNGGIESQRWDRRVISHKYNNMNEIFCIDNCTKDEILEEGVFGDFNELPNWKKGIIRWYQRHII